MSGTVARQYRISEAAFLDWAVSVGRRAEASDPGAVDLTLSAYFDYLYLDGCEPWEGRQALYGFAHVHRFPRPKDTFPHATKALAGWVKRAPEASRDPCPWEALALLATWFLGLGTLEGVLAAACSVVQFDVYGRPSATLALTLDHIVVGSGRANRRYNQLAVIMAPSGPNRKPAKNLQFDDTVIVGSMSPDRVWIKKVVEQLVARCKRLKINRLFEGLDLHTYETLFRRGSEALSLQELRLCPHTVRHGGPSVDFLEKRGPLELIKRRGHWLSDRSVARYGKEGKLLRQVNKMTARQQRDGARAAASLAALLDQKLRGILNTRPP